MLRIFYTLVASIQNKLDRPSQYPLELAAENLSEGNEFCKPFFNFKPRTNHWIGPFTEPCHSVGSLRPWAMDIARILPSNISQTIFNKFRRCFYFFLC